MPTPAQTAAAADTTVPRIAIQFRRLSSFGICLERRCRPTGSTAAKAAWERSPAFCQAEPLAPSCVSASRRGATRGTGVCCSACARRPTNVAFSPRRRLTAGSEGQHCRSSLGLRELYAGLAEAGCSAWPLCRTDPGTPCQRAATPVPLQRESSSPAPVPTEVLIGVLIAERSTVQQRCGQRATRVCSASTERQERRPRLPNARCSFPISTFGHRHLLITAAEFLQR
jgi:hypothetical protein